MKGIFCTASLYSASVIFEALRPLRISVSAMVLRGTFTICGTVVIPPEAVRVVLGICKSTVPIAQSAAFCEM